MKFFLTALVLYILFFVSGYAEENKVTNLDGVADILAKGEIESMKSDLNAWTDEKTIKSLSDTLLTVDYIKELYKNFKDAIVSPPNPDIYTKYSIENAEESLAKVEKLGQKIHNMLFAVSDEDVEKYGKLLQRMRDVLYIDWKHIPYAIQHNNSRVIYWYQLHTKWLENVAKEYLSLSLKFAEAAARIEQNNNDNIINLKYNNIINGMRVEVTWRPNNLQNGYVIGPAIIQFTNIKYGTSSTAVNNHFGIKEERIDRLLKIKKKNNVEGKFVGEYNIKGITNETIKLDYNKSTLKDDRFTFMGATDEPFFFYDLDFDDKEELMVCEMFNGQRWYSTFKAYNLSEDQDIEVIGDSLYQITYDEPYISLDEISTVNIKDKTLSIITSCGASCSKSKIYKLDSANHNQGNRYILEKIIE